ncbi:MAG: amidase family protein, partial [Candidatus Methylomirabilia bacterium]
MTGDDLRWVSALELGGLIRSKQVSPVEVTEAVLAGIKGVDPTLNAFCTLTPEIARRDAREAEIAVMKSEPLGLLHGIPVSIKDLVFTRGVRTTGGSRIYADFSPDQDAVAVERLKAAGAVLLGKTNTPEFGHKGVT